MEKIIPIFYACDDNFVKYTIVSLKSMIDNASKEYKYKVYIMITNLSKEMSIEAKKLENENFEINFIDVVEYLDTINDKLPIRDYYSKTTYFRLFIAEMFPQYDKVVYIDSDTIVLGDISKFFNNDLKSNYLGACKEQAMVQEDIYGTYVEQNLGIDRNRYFNAGVLLINAKAFREEKILEQFIELLHVYTFRVTQDEDYLNVICQNKVLWIDSSWNCEVFGTLPCKEEDINVIHFIMVSKPWHFTNCRLQEHFWKYAKQTDVCPLIEKDLANYTDEQRKRDIESGENLAKLAIAETQREDTYLRIINKGKAIDRVHIINKIEQYEAEGRFDEDVENDPPTRELLPNEVDYKRKKLISKLKAKVAFAAARKFLNQIIDEQKLIIKDIKGVENFKELNCGAIITCNHFNAFDSFAIQMAYEAANQKGRKFFRVIREGNYTNFPGFYGFLMKNCNTLPLSSNALVMREFIKSTDQLLQDGHFVLFYPEQSMWWNYRKPKPLKDGAYRFAAKNRVPVLPCFITLEDSNLKGEDGFPIQEYTIHIGKPIYPDLKKSLSENTRDMKQANYDVWKKIYEDCYNIPLEYNCEPDLIKY